MNTTDLFNFPFVDRTREQERLNNFLSNVSSNTLWIKGEHGLGKTEFFKYVLKERADYKLCYIDIKINTNSVQIFEDFIIELQKISTINFMSSVRNKYKKFYKATKEINLEIFHELQSLIRIILDAGYYAITWQDETKDPLDIITDYMRSILNERKLCICIDNFSRCDEDTMQRFIQIIKKFINEDNFRSCIITVDKDLSENSEIIIRKNLPIVLPVMDILPLAEEKYFRQIMNHIFELSDISRNDLTIIYKKCEGSPKQLVKIIGKLMEKGGIRIVQKGKARIDREVLRSILKSPSIKYEGKEFTSRRKWVIYSYLCLREEESIELIEQLALYISKKIRIYCIYDVVSFYKEIDDLENLHILKYTHDNNITYCHDLDYFELTNIFNQDPLKKLFSQYAYEFLLQQKNDSLYKDLLCCHAKEAQITGWVKMNFRHGKKLFHNGQLYDAQKVFSRLEDVLTDMNPLQVLFVAITSYETGNFQLSIDQIHLIEPVQLRFRHAKFYYYFYLGKNYNNIGRTDLAIINLEKALSETKEGSKTYVHALNILHMYYLEIPEKIDTAKEIFNKIRYNYKEIYPVIWANTMRGCQNFLSNEEALEVLENAKLNLTSELENAFLLTTKGFVLIKSNENVKAKLCFRTSSETIKRLKIHEYSYAANNLAVCYMMEKNYTEAKEILLEALLWNRTDYGEIVLKVHLMICCLYLNNQSETMDYFKYLDAYMAKCPVDPIINRKVHMNLAIVCDRLKNDIEKKVHISKASNYIKGSTSEWRYNMLVDPSKIMEQNRPTCLYQQVTDFDPWFLIYAHD